MKQGKYEKAVPSARKKRGLNTRSVTLVLALVLLVGSVVGGTLAWLTANSDTVTNTFTESGISITLSEDNPATRTAQMIPGWTIDKDPKVTVNDDSEDCWLFVKITESTNPDLDTYISYAIADLFDASSNPDGWQIVQAENDADGEIVIGRKVYKDDTTKAFGIIGYTDTNGTDVTTDDAFVPDKVLVNDTVTKTLMDAIDGNNSKPTLSFRAAAVQLYKTNSDGDPDTTTDEFSVTDAYAKVVWPD